MWVWGVGCHGVCTCLVCACVARMNGREDDVGSGALKNCGDFMIQMCVGEGGGGGGGGRFYKQIVHYYLSEL